MKAILYRITHHKTKPISGEVMQDGLNRITLVVYDNKGSSKIRSFTKDKYVIRYY